MKTSRPHFALCGALAVSGLALAACSDEPFPTLPTSDSSAMGGHATKPSQSSSGSGGADGGSPIEPWPYPCMTDEPARSFPCAEGYGTDSPGGRGGQLIEVTHLGDAGAGSLRAALEASGPRIIVFRVGGTIEAEDDFIIKEPFVTIAGQSAPGGGIAIKNATIKIKTHDVVMRYLRVRVGDLMKHTDQTNRDAINISGAERVVIDHVSASWATDEVVSASSSNDVTISWSIIAEPLQDAGHVDGMHGYGSLLRASTRLSLHHNLYAHTYRRAPGLSPKGTQQPKILVLNNVVYGYVDSGSKINDGLTEINYLDAGYYDFIGNYYRPGPTQGAEPPWEIVIEDLLQTNSHIYLKHNLGPHRPNHDSGNWQLVFNKSEHANNVYKASQPFDDNHGITVNDTEKNVALVLADAGATVPARDAVDKRILNDVTTISGGMVNSQNDVGGWPALAAGTAPTDSDHDGMPDSWENSHGFDANDPNDGNSDPNGDGYTAVESYLNAIPYL